MPKKRKPDPRSQFLFKDFAPEPDSKSPSPPVIPLDFESQRVRMIVIKGAPWWVLYDIARILGYRDTDKAKRLLRKDQTTTPLEGCSYLRADTVLVSESGLYRLMMRSDRPEAERFQDWITDDVLPAIRHTGTYKAQRLSRVDKTAKRLKMDREPAKVRCDQNDINRPINLALAADGAIPRDFADRHNAVYRGQFGVAAPELRRRLGLKNFRQTPLDHMHGLVLSQNYHAKFLAERKIQLAQRQLSRSEQNVVFEETANDIADADFLWLGANGDFDYGIVDHPDRGKIIDVVRD